MASSVRTQRTMSAPSARQGGAASGVDAGRTSKPAPTMRKSCHFCRSRKIRCSGESICGACRERNIDCSYECEGAKGRPKGSAPKAPRKGSVDSAGNGASIPQAPAAPSQQPWSEANTAHHVAAATTTADASVDTSIASELQTMFQRLFIAPEGGAQPLHLSDGTPMQAFNCRRSSQDAAAGLQMSPTSQHPPPPPCLAPTMTYEGVFLGLTQELVEFLTSRFGSLGSHHLDAQQELFLVACLDRDTTTSIFDAGSDGPNPLMDYDGHKISQLIEVWFAHHPLAFLVSKTLLLRGLRTGSHDPLLLAVILADAAFVQDTAGGRAEGKRLFRWAASRLFTRSKESVDLPLLQAMVLIGWHELCTARARRAMCLLGWAGHVLPNLPPPQRGINQVNGIDVGEVAAEVSCNVHWLIFAVTLWALMQTDSPIAELLPGAPTTFPPVDEAASAVFRLDTMSDNLSTLPHQARLFRELWPLCHVASTTAHIYALYPRRPTAADDPSQPACWQMRTLWQLRHLSDPRQDLSLLCGKIRHVLLHALELIEAHVANHVSQALVLSVYHTMIVHFLFPRQDDAHLPFAPFASAASSTSTPLTDRLLSDFAASASALLQIMSMLHRPTDRGAVVMGARPSSLADVFALGLDACGKAFNALCARVAGGAAPAGETARLRARGPELLPLARDLHALSQHSAVLPTARARICKKQLKYAVRSLEALQQLDASAVHGLPTGYHGGHGGSGSNSSLSGGISQRSASSASMASSDLDLDLDLEMELASCPTLASDPPASAAASAAMVSPFLQTPLGCEQPPLENVSGALLSLLDGSNGAVSLGGSNAAAFVPASPDRLIDAGGQPQFAVATGNEESLFERAMFGDELQNAPSSPFKKDLAAALPALNAPTATMGSGGTAFPTKDVAMFMGAPLGDVAEDADSRAWIDGLASVFAV